MKHWLIYTLSLLLLFSCEKKHDDGAVSMSIEQRDSLLIEYIVKEFDYDDEARYNRFKSDFGNQLSHLRKSDSSYYTREAKFKNYHLKSFDFDSQGWCPFAIEVTDTDKQFISFFTFTDEAFYRGNSINTGMVKSIARDSILSGKINLEKNINSLIKKLNIREKEDIENFVQLIFVDLFSMNRISKDSIQNIMNFYWSRSDLNDSIRQYVDIEQLRFFSQGNDRTLMVRTKYSGPGYWRFWVEKNEDSYVIRSAFFSDMLYRPFYM